MPKADPPAEQAGRRPRRTPYVLALEAELETVRQARDALLGERDDAARQHDADVGAILRATARADHAEALLALAVRALAQWRDDEGHGLDPRAGDALATIATAMLGTDPDHRPPRARQDHYAGPWNDPPDGTCTVPGHADHPADDEPPTEP